MYLPGRSLAVGDRVSDGAMAERACATRPDAPHGRLKRLRIGGDESPRFDRQLMGEWSDGCYARPREKKLLARENAIVLSLGSPDDHCRELPAPLVVPDGQYAAPVVDLHAIGERPREHVGGLSRFLRGGRKDQGHARVPSIPLTGAPERNARGVYRQISISGHHDAHRALLPAGEDVHRVHDARMSGRVEERRHPGSGGPDGHEDRVEPFIEEAAQGSVSTRRSASPEDDREGEQSIAFGARAGERKSKGREGARHQASRLLGDLEDVALVTEQGEIVSTSQTRWPRTDDGDPFSGCRRVLTLGDPGTDEPTNGASIVGARTRAG